MPGGTISGLCLLAKWYAREGDCARALLILEQSTKIARLTFGEAPAAESRTAQPGGDSRHQRRDPREVARVRVYNDIDKALAAVERSLH